MTTSPANSSIAAPLQLVIIQANPTVGAIPQNLAQILAARRAHPTADLLVFSECFLTGYPLQDLVSLPHFIADTGHAIDRLAAQIRAEPGPAVLFGAPTAGADQPYNSAILIRADGTVALTHKRELPNNDVFDEVRTFARGQGPAQPLQLNADWRLGVMICEDAWHKRVASALEGEGANLLIVINGSPCRLEKQAQRLQQMRRRVAETQLPLLYVNQVGGQDELVFDGASFALGRQGEPLARLAAFQPDAAALTVTRDDRGRTQLDHTGPVALPHPAPGEAELLYRAGVLGIQDYVEKNGIPFVRVAVSGGADSAAALAMACDAVGPDRVIGYRLPSALTGEESMTLASDLMQRLGCRAETIRIDGLVDVALQATAHLSLAGPQAAGLARENLQPRLRMLLMMLACNLADGILLGTSNKSESSVGYTTMFGDMAAHYNPLKDLYKTDVWTVMRWRNQQIPAGSLCPVADPIPQAIIDRPPTAEIAAGQTDEASLGSYQVLDPLLQAMIERQLDAETARRTVERALGIAITPAYANRIAGLIYKAEFKRRQACIGPQLRPNSFGLGRRYPITNAFKERTDHDQPAQRPSRTLACG